MIGRGAATLVLATVLTGSAEAQDPQAIEVRDSSTADTKRSRESTKRLAADGTKEAGGTALRNTASASPDHRARPARKLTIQQKRIFVLGLGAGGKK